VSERALREALRRAQAFRALARAFAAPRDVTRLRADLAALAAHASAPVAQPAARARETLAALGDGLADAHQRLFGHGGVPLRESAYADARRIAPTELADLRGFLAAFGVAERDELADHVASECELASLLALKHAWALGEGQVERAAIAEAAYRALVVDHLAQFVPRFAARVREAEAPAFFRAAVDALEALVRQEAGGALAARPPAGGGDGERDVACGAFECGGCGVS
jgi:TorA maturation chaperone TorD